MQPVFSKRVHDLGCAIMAIASEHDLHARPIAADAPDDMSDHPGGFLAGGTLARAQNSSDGFPGSRLEDQDRLKTGVARMRREQRKLLSAMGQIDGGRRCRARSGRARGHSCRRRCRSSPAPCARASASSPHSPAGRESAARPARHPRPGTLVAGDPQRRVMAQNIEVVAVLMPAGDGDHSRLDHVSYE